MDGNRLERVTPDGVYKCRIVYDPKGALGILGTDASYKAIWDRMPSWNLNKGLTSKMIGECVGVVKEAIKENRRLPSCVVAIADESTGIVYSAPQKIKLPKNKLRTFNDRGDLYRATFFKHAEGIIGIAGERFGVEWSRIPVRSDEGFVTKLYSETIESGNQFYQENNHLPRQVTTVGFEEIGLVYTLAE